MHNHHTQQPPLAQYSSAIGYEFPWGHILERRVNQYVVWDFCLSHLLLQYLQAGKRLEDCQKQVFKVLERKFDCTTRDVVTLVSLAKAWQLCPSSSVGIFIKWRISLLNKRRGNGWWRSCWRYCRRLSRMHNLL